MANKKTAVLTVENYTEIMDTLTEGGTGLRPNIRIATILAVVVATGEKLVKILDTVVGEYEDIGGKYSVIIGSKRYIIPEHESEIVNSYLWKYMKTPHDKMFDISARGVEKILKQVCDYLDIPNVGINSFRSLYSAILKIEEIAPSKTGLSNRTIQGVYSIRCKHNGRIYIGESSDINKRWDDHVLALQSRNHRSKLLQEDYNKYGESGFDFSVLAISSREKERRAIESNYIRALGTIRYGYNTRA